MYTFFASCFIVGVVLNVVFKKTTSKSPIINFKSFTSSIWGKWATHKSKADSIGLEQVDFKSLRAEGKKIEPVEKYFYKAVCKGPTGSLGHSGPSVMQMSPNMHKFILKSVVGQTEGISTTPFGKPTKDDFFQFGTDCRSYTIRILPNSMGGQFFETAEQHYLGKDNVVQCRHSHPDLKGFDIRCPICIHRKKLEEKYSKHNNDYRVDQLLRDNISKLIPDRRYYYNILVMDNHGKFDASHPQLLSVSESFHKKLIKEIRKVPFDVTDLNYGCNIEVKRNSNSVEISISNLRTQIVDNESHLNLLKNIFDLKSVIKNYDKPNEDHFMALRKADVGYTGCKYT